MSTNATLIPDIDVDLGDLVGLSNLSEDESLVAFAQYGGVVLRNTLTRLFATLTESEQQMLQDFLSTDPDASTMLNHLSTVYPQFDQLLTEVITTLKAELTEALVNAAENTTTSDTAR